MPNTSTHIAQGRLGPSTRRLLRPALIALAILGLPTAAVAAASGGRFAYVDPGAGSFILQAVVATLAGVVVAANAYWSKIKAFLGWSTDDDEDEASANRDDA